MSDINNDFRDHRDDFYKEHKFRGQKNHGAFGFMLLLVGFVMLAYYFGWVFLPNYAVWPLILIAVGIYIGIKHRFRNNAPFVLIIIGALNLIPRFYIGDVSSTKLAAPAILIALGLLFMLRPKKGYCPPGMRGRGRERIVTSTNPEDLLNIDVTFGGRKAVVTSKQFKGGNISVAFAGAEINLMQADSTEPMILDMKVSFGGVEIIVPSHWDVQIDMQPTFGNVEDHRMVRTLAATEQKKLLILRGSCSFGNVELKSY